MITEVFEFDYLFEMLEKNGKKMREMYFDSLEENVKLKKEIKTLSLKYLDLVEEKIKLKKENEKLRSFRKWALGKGTLII